MTLSPLPLGMHLAHLGPFTGEGLLVCPPDSAEVVLDLDPLTGSGLMAWADCTAALSGLASLGWVLAEDVDGSAIREGTTHDVRYAVEVAAAGGHHLLLSGSKGSGKTSIAERIPGLLPDLTREEAVELAAVQSLAGAVDAGAPWPSRPPFSAPHHDATKASLVGGGSGQVRPGEISRAHTGVLFLDKLR